MFFFSRIGYSKHERGETEFNSIVNILEDIIGNRTLYNHLHLSPVGIPICKYYQTEKGESSILLCHLICPSILNRS